MSQVTSICGRQGGDHAHHRAGELPEGYDLRFGLVAYEDHPPQDTSSRHVEKVCDSLSRSR